MLKIFWDVLKAVSTNVMKKFRDRSRKNSEKLFCETQSFSKYSFAHRECSFDKPRLFSARKPIFIWMLVLFSESSSPAQIISRNLNCRFNDSRKNLVKRPSFFHSKFGILFIIMINISKWSSGQVTGSFCRTYRKFLPCALSFFAQNPNNFIQLKIFQRFFCAPIFLGEILKAPSTNPTKYFRGGSKTIPKKQYFPNTIFLQRFLSTRGMQF